jgi:hypothetical protein
MNPMARSGACSADSHVAAEPCASHSPAPMMGMEAHHQVEVPDDYVAQAVWVRV